MAHGSPWFPFWISDYTADTQHLSCEQHGAYLLLMMTYYRRCQPLDDDNTSLAGITKLTPRKWLAMRPVLARFFQVKGGQWRHKRIDAEIAEQQARHDERSMSGAKGAASRERNRGKPRGASQAEHEAEPKPDKLDAKHQAELDEPLPKTQRLSCHNRGNPRAKIKHTSQVEGLGPKEPNSFYQHTRESSPPLPSRGDGVAASRSPDPPADDLMPKAEAAAELGRALLTLRSKMGLLDSDATVLPLPDPRLIAHRDRLQRINTFAGERLRGEARMQAWEVIGRVDKFTDPDAIPPPLLAELVALESLVVQAEAAE